MTPTQLNHDLCTAIETPPVWTYLQVNRDEGRGFDWPVDYYVLSSPKGFWVADLGPRDEELSDDNHLVPWEPAGLDGSIAWAWRVVEAMKSRGWVISLIARYDGWDAQFRCIEPLATGAVSFREGVIESGDTAPEAICRAALSALNP